MYHNEWRDIGQKDFSTLPGPQYYTTKDAPNVPFAEKVIQAEKFGSKILI